MPSTSYAPSEATIETAIAKRIGSAGFFQRVAEQLARGIYLDCADSIVPFGRRSDDKTVEGWPDAFLTKSDGSLIAIEATTASKARTAHWPNDLAKLQRTLEPKRRGGLIWVAWCEPTRATDAAKMQDQVVKLGLRREDIHILFRRDICARLRTPIHARFLINDLGLRVSPAPFLGVEDIIARVSTRRLTGIFPTAIEYEEHRVYAPPVLADIEAALDNQHAALVVGHGASGKTTLAMVLSHRPRFRNLPAYYLDLTSAETDPTLVERSGEALAGLADNGVLFIVDNAHLSPRTAVQLLGQWEKFGVGSKLLILTRRVRTKTEVWDDEPELEGLPIPNLDLVIQANDLEGVYRRHYRARRDAEAAPVEAKVLDRWYKIFGGDLLVFSAAVLGLLDREGTPAELEVKDAEASVNRRYLAAPEFAQEKLALLALAAVAEIEGIVPLGAFAENALRQCIRRGIVWVESRGSRRKFHSVRLAHPGLGTLLRSAAGQSTTSREVRSLLLQAHPYACVATAARANKAGQIDEAKALLEALWQYSKWPLEDLPLRWWPIAHRLTMQRQALPAEELPERVIQWLNQPENTEMLVKRALSTPLNFLASFLTFADTTMPVVSKAVRDGLAKNSDTLVKLALSTPLHFFASFLTYADKTMPPVSRAVRDGLAKNSDTLVKRALATPLGDLASFLTYADKTMPPVSKAVRDGLAKNSDTLVKQALSTPLHFLASFLTYADTTMPVVSKAVRDGLAKNSATLVKQALVTPLGHLASFLIYAETAMPEVWSALSEALSKEEHRQALVDRALATSLDHLVSFLRYAHPENTELLYILTGRRPRVIGVAAVLLDALAAQPTRGIFLERARGAPRDQMASFLRYVDFAHSELVDAFEAGN